MYIRPRKKDDTAFILEQNMFVANIMSETRTSYE